MGALRAGFNGTVGQSSAQVIDGSLKFDGATTPQYLTRTLGSGNTKTFTMSYWFKYDSTTNGRRYISTGYNADGNTYGWYIGDNSNLITFNDTGTNSADYNVRPSGVLRDNGWYHLVYVFDSTQSNSDDRVRIYVNGVQQTSFSTNTRPDQDATGNMNRSGHVLSIGAWNIGGTYASGLEGQIAQFYHIDGQGLDASYFGFTDGLTNTWRPKKYTGTFTGTNTFYLPFDGNSPIGEDKSGNGNDFTPVNFGGSVALDNPQVSGARPILNTGTGGTVARPGVFGSEVGANYTVTVASVGGGNRYHFDGVDRPNPTLIRGATYTFDQSDSSNSNHPLRFATAADAAGSSQYTDGVTTNGTPGSAGAYTKITVPHNSPNTLHYYCTNHGGMGSSTSQTTDETKADPYAWKNVLATPLVGSANDISNSVNSGSTTKTITVTNAVASSAQSNFYNGSWYFDGTGDYLSMSESDFTNISSSDAFTIEAFVYLNDLDAYSTVFASSNSSFSTGGFKLEIYNNKVRVQANSLDLNSGMTLSTKRWYHLAFSRTSDGKAYSFVNGILDNSATGKTFEVTWPVSVRIGAKANDTEYLNGFIQDFRYYKGVAKYTSNFVVPATSPDILPDTPSGVSGSSKLAKVTDGAVYFDDSGDYLSLASSSDFTLSGEFTIECYAYYGGSGKGMWMTIGEPKNTSAPLGFEWYHTPGASSNSYRVFGDDGYLFNVSNTTTSKVWHHVAISRDSSNNLRIWRDGKQIGSNVSDSNTYQGAVYIGAEFFNGSITDYMDGFISNFRFINGTCLYASDFTPPIRALTNVTNTKLLCCQSPTSATEGAVKPGTITANGDAAATTFNPFTTDINAVRGQETGYATLNPLSRYSALVPSDGNLVFTDDDSSNGGDQGIQATIMPTSGKYYWEVTPTALASENYYGVSKQNKLTQTVWTGGAVDAYFYYNNGKKIGGGNGNGGQTYGDSFGIGDVIGVAVSWDDGTITFYKNGVSQGVAFSGVDLTGYIPSIYLNTNQTGAGRINFGQKPFKFLPPDGFQPINAANVRPETVITRPDQFVGVVAYTGDGNSPREIGGFGFQPDLVVYKERSEARDWQWYDSVRGVGPAKNLVSNTTYAETANDDTQYGYTSSFNKDGFTVTNGTGGGNANIYTNKNGQTYASWTWKAGGSKNTFNVDDVGYASAAAAGLDGGSINPTGASVGTKQGFSILKYQGNGTAGANISHGLLEAPKLMIHKSLDQSRNWYTITTALDGSADYLYLNTQGAAQNSSVTVPTSSLMYFTSSVESNNNSENYVAYLWHDVPGLQKFGSFEANQNADGPFVELGFRPAMVWIKNIDNYDPPYDWVIYDNARSTFNPNDKFLSANLSNAENSGSGGTDNARYVDFLSNGFKVRTASTAINLNAHTQLYCAWAEAPTVNLFGGQSNAR